MPQVGSDHGWRFHKLMFKTVAVRSRAHWGWGLPLPPPLPFLGPWPALRYGSGLPSDHEIPQRVLELELELELEPGAGFGWRRVASKQTYGQTWM
jgi:hypothetical protein